MGTADRAIRIVIAIIVVTLYFTSVITGTTGIVLMALAAIFLITGFISFCPLYTPFGLNTCSRKK
ncbi:YgaP family membrane protein [Mangrovivirga halotolerans]